jgi:tetratricopeptide (TPR) repeat protein
VEKRADTFVVLPVIRRYVLDPIRFPKDIRESTVGIACAFLKEHNASEGEGNYLAHTNARSLEEANLQGILLETTTADPDIIKALLILSNHQQKTRPRLDVSKHALKLSKTCENQKWYAEALYCYGQNLRSICCYEEAMEQLHLARQAFLHVSESKQAADALFWIAFTSTYITGQSNIHDMEDALAESQSLAYPAGIVNCQLNLSSLSDAQSIPTFTSLHQFCILNNLPIQQQDCTRSITYTYLNLGRFDKAKEWGLIALEEAKQMNVQPQTSDALQIVGSICISLGDYHQAVEYLMEGIQSSKTYGSPLLIARTLFHLGRAWMKKGQKEDAQGAFLETFKYCEMLQEAWEGPATQRACRFYLDKLENPSREPDSEEMDALWRLDVENDYESAGTPIELDVEDT